MTQVISAPKADLVEWVDAQLAEPGEALYRLLSLTARDLRRAFTDGFREQGLTGAQFGVLIGASHHANIGEIAEQLLTDATSVGRLVERMEEGGLVKRFREAPDRRVVWVKLTARGEEVLRTALPRHVARAEELLSFLTVRQRETLVNALTRVRSQVATTGPDGDVT